MIQEHVSLQGKNGIEVRALELLPRQAEQHGQLARLPSREAGDLPHLVDALAQFVRLWPILCQKRRVCALLPISGPSAAPLLIEHGMPMRKHQISRVNHY